MENVEIKVRIKNFSAILAKLRTLKARRCGLLVQRDTYFACPNGRLKLREFPGKPAQLILYNRAERSADRLSRFHILEIRNPAAFTAFLRRIFPVWAVVSKKRELYYVKTARIHLDRVRGLGSFLEIESEVK
ncbi:MAG TPA: class IV adenylate cyclase, partial [Elusimicrobiales bacterium]|nr:class IV adenylate cyclase [Elusimicrobiales bacterium]